MIDYDRYPALVTTPDGSWNRCALVIEDGVAEVAVPDGYGGVTVVATHDGFSTLMAEADSPGVAFLYFADGTTWTVAHGDGCACPTAASRWLRARRYARI